MAYGIGFGPFSGHEGEVEQIIVQGTKKKEAKWRRRRDTLEAEQKRAKADQVVTQVVGATQLPLKQAEAADEQTPPLVKAPRARIPLPLEKAGAADARPLVPKVLRAMQPLPQKPIPLPAKVEVAEKPLPLEPKFQEMARFTEIKSTNTTGLVCKLDPSEDYEPTVVEGIIAERAALQAELDAAAEPRVSSDPDSVYAWIDNGDPGL